MTFYSLFFTWGLLIYGLATFLLLTNDLVYTMINGAAPSKKIRAIYWYLLLLPAAVLFMRAFDPWALDRSHDLEFLKSGNHLILLFLWFLCSAINVLMGLPRKEDKKLVEEF